ncbi:hypothetical protein [Nocardia sp. GAS34]|uniref:hypothetical protein n=1 Tax=unclassified Nocardia TaxID=2637762 RepID=UPI003D1BB9EF
MGFGIAALITAAAAVLAPQAAAKELALGLTCGDDYTCRNDTDDTYRVTWRMNCTTGLGQQSTTWVSPHRTEALRPSCPTYYKPGFTDDFSEWIPGSPRSVEYLSAEVDDNPASHGGPSTGSAAVRCIRCVSVGDSRGLWPGTARRHTVRIDRVVDRSIGLTDKPVLGGEVHAGLVIARAPEYPPGRSRECARTRPDGGETSVQS